MKNYIIPRFLMLGFFLSSTFISKAQITSDKWPEAKISYYEKPKLMANIDIMSAEMGPIMGIFYGAGVDYSLNNKIYLGIDAQLPMLDKSFINEGKSSKMYSGNCELVFSSKRKSKSTRITLERKSVGYNMEEITYRDYDIMSPIEKVFRFSANFYNNSVNPRKMNTKDSIAYGYYSVPGFKNEKGQISDGVANEKVLFVSAGIGWKDISYYFVELPDINRIANFATVMNTYVDFLYSPVINLVDKVDYKKMPLGFRTGLDVSFNKSKLGAYCKMEAGMLPGVGTAPLYFKIGFGLKLRFEKLKIADNK